MMSAKRLDDIGIWGGHANVVEARQARTRQAVPASRKNAAPGTAGLERRGEGECRSDCGRRARRQPGCERSHKP